MATTKFLMTKDIGGYNGFGVKPSTVNFGMDLATGVAQTAVLPSDYPNYMVVFSYTPGSNVFVDSTTTAAAYGASAAVTAELNPQARQLPAGTTISFITPDAAGSYVQVGVFVAPPYGN